MRMIEDIKKRARRVTVLVEKQIPYGRPACVVPRCLQDAGRHACVPERTSVCRHVAMSIHHIRIKAYGRFALWLCIFASCIMVFNLRTDFANAPVSFSFGPSVLFADTFEERQNLENQLTQIQNQIDQYEKNIADIQGQKKTLANEIKLFNAKIASINLQIKSLDLEIRRLNLRVTDVGLDIKDSESKIDTAHKVLAGSLNNLYEMDRISLLEMLVAQGTISTFFDELNAQTVVQEQAKAQLDKIKVLKTNLETQQEDLVSRREDQQSLRQLQANQRQALANQGAAKNKLLADTKGKENAYQSLLQKSKQTAAQIRAQLYELLGGGEIKFEDALKYADFASGQAGVRSALILAVLDRESTLGKNVGKCSWQTAMHPTRDKPLFAQITQALGLNPDSMPVSCPILSDGSYGGAMGVAQFLPSTWMLYKDRIQKITGSYPSPWNPRDAFLATALYLADAGARDQTYASERIAAAKYYAGSRWRYYLYSYGARVMERVSYYAEQISILQKANS